MNMLILGSFIASRGVVSPAVAVSVAFAMMVVTLTTGLLLDTLRKLLVSLMVVTATPTANNVKVMDEMVAEIKQGLFMCIFSAVNCFTIISRYAALRLRGRRHVFLVVQLLSHEHVVDMKVTAEPTQSFSWTVVESVPSSCTYWFKDGGVFC